jgi:hypothetical protein
MTPQRPTPPRPPVASTRAGIPPRPLSVPPAPITSPSTPVISAPEPAATPSPSQSFARPLMPSAPPESYAAQSYAAPSPSELAPASAEPWGPAPSYKPQPSYPPPAYSAPPVARDWYLYMADGRHLGPLSTDFLARGWLTGQIPPNMYVGTAGEPGWYPVAQVPEIMDAVRALQG